MRKMYVFVKITALNNISTFPKPICDKNTAKKVLLSIQNSFLDVETAFRHTFSSSD